MKSLTIKKLYNLHSWVGIITGILLFIIAFTGAVAVFARPELKIWATEELRTPVKVSAQQYSEKVALHAKEVGPDYLEEVHIRIPGATSSEHLRVIYEGHFTDENGKEAHKGIVYAMDPNTLEVEVNTDMETFFNSGKHDISSFLANFHADLHLGKPLGLILTGLLGLTLMVSIATGFFIHRKKLAQLFTFRIRKTFSLALNDGHKVMSIWGILFHSMIGFTGAFLGLATVILVPAAAYVGFNGDQEKLIETFTAIKAPIMAHVEQPTKLEEILDYSFTSRPDLTFNNITVMGYNDKNALVYVQGNGSEQLGGETLVFQGATGEFIKSQANFGRLEGVTGKILDAMFPLHFGNFGGIFIKTIWAILGITTALLPITGLMLWIERGINAKNPAHSRETYRKVYKVLVGSCGGIVLATVMLFPTQLILNKFITDMYHTTIIFNVFFITWLISCLIPFVIDVKKATKLITLAIACLMLATMPMDIVLTGSHLFNVFTTQHYISVSVDFVVFLLGALLMLTFYSVEKKSVKTAEKNGSSKWLETPNDFSDEIATSKGA